MTKNIVAQIAALKAMPTPQLKLKWLDLFECEAQPHNRRYLESRIAYRLQELAFGGLKQETVERLDALANGLADGKAARRMRQGDLPVRGTRLVREWQGEEHVVTVLTDGFDWQGRTYKSLSAIARAITGSRWNGWAFFGLKKQNKTPRRRLYRHGPAPERQKQDQA